MQTSRFSDDQLVAILREDDRTLVVEVARKRRVGEQTIYVWRKHLAGMAGGHEAKRLKAADLENAKLKRVPADRELD